MNGFDVVLSRAVPHSVLRSELARALTVKTDDCLVVDVGNMDLPEMASRIFCTIAIVGGEFPVLLSINAPDSFALPSATTLAEQLSRFLEMSVLVDDGSSHPYRMTLIRWNAAARTVFIKPGNDDRIDLVDDSFGQAS